jgi:hypothetical protein
MNELNNCDLIVSGISELRIKITRRGRVSYVSLTSLMKWRQSQEERCDETWPDRGRVV